MFELLFNHGGTQGLCEAVLLCKEAHVTGNMHCYVSPLTLLENQGAPWLGLGLGLGLGQAAGQLSKGVKAAGSGSTAADVNFVWLEGGSSLEAIVVVLAWLLTLQEAAR